MPKRGLVLAILVRIGTKKVREMTLQDFSDALPWLSEFDFDAQALGQKPEATAADILKVVEKTTDWDVLQAAAQALVRKESELLSMIE